MIPCLHEKIIRRDDYSFRSMEANILEQRCADPDIWSCDPGLIEVLIGEGQL